MSEVLRVNTEHTKDLLKQELEIRLSELLEDWHMSSLEKIFIEKRIYRDIEECETWEGVIETIDKGLDPFKKLFLQGSNTGRYHQAHRDQDQTDLQIRCEAGRRTH